MMAATQNSRTAIYHLGRGGGYATLGFGAGWVGEGLLKNTYFTWLSSFAAVILVALFALTGLKMISGGVAGKGTGNPNGYLQKFWVQLLRPIWRWPGALRSVAVGLLTPLLPCGFLYSFVLLAAATSSPWRGLIVLSVFWLGTVPALVVTRFGLGAFAAKGLAQRSIGVLFVALALFMVTQKIQHFREHGLPSRAELSNEASSARLLPLICR